MHLLLQQVVNGLLLGGMFALMSVGLSMVFGLMKTANFAYGGLYMLGGYCAYWASALLGLSYLGSLLLAFVLLFGAGVLVERLGFEPLRGNGDATLIFGLGLALMLRGLAVIAWGSQARFMDAPTSGSLHWGWLVLPSARLWACVASLTILAALYLVVHRSRWGRLVRAVADDPNRAALLGIRVQLHSSLVFGLGTGLSALACVFLMPVLSLSPTVDDSAMYTAFAVVILGGLGSIAGCLLGAMILGLVSTLSLEWSNSVIAPAFPLLVLLLVLLFKPQGLLGQRGRMA